MAIAVIHLMTARFAAGTIVAMTLLTGRARVRADEIAADDGRLDAALRSSPIVGNFNRIAVLLAGDRTQAGLTARSGVAAALRAAGHEVDVDEELIPDPPDRGRVSKIAAVHEASAVATVRISTDGGPERLTVLLYNLGGYPVFEFAGRLALTAIPPTQPSPLPAPRPIVPLPVNPLVIEGAGFYDAVGRPDLAARYRHADALKTTSRVVGGGAILLGVVWGILDLIFTAVENAGADLSCAGSSNPSSSNPCPQKSVSVIPWTVAALGLGALVIPSFISSDPLTDAQKRSLVYGPRSGPSFSAGVAPSQGGGSLFVAGRF
jgi:hypothetical protein